MEKKLEEKIVKKTTRKKEQVEVMPSPAPVEPQKIESINKPNKIAISVHKNAIIALVVVIIIAAIGGLLFYYKGLFISATINGTPISRLAVISELESVYGKKTLESLITKKLIDNEALAKGIKVSQEEINAEIKTVEDQLKAQGMTLDQALIEQGVTLNYLKNQIEFQKKIETLLADQIQVSEEDITKFIADNQITVPEGEEANYNEQITSQLKQEKLSSAASALLESLRVKSKIKYFTNY